MIACGLPFHFGEIAMIGGGIAMGAAIVGRLCWCYIKARFVKTRLDKPDCECDCCHHQHDDVEEKKHEALPPRLPESDRIGIQMGLPHDPGCKVIHDGPCKNPRPL
jgi:hypothetical protein